MRGFPLVGVDQKWKASAPAPAVPVWAADDVAAPAPTPPEICEYEPVDFELALVAEKKGSASA